MMRSPRAPTALSEDAKIVYAVGPLTATGVPLAGRTTVCFLSTFTTDYQVVDAHCGGMLGAKIKMAGYDAIIVEGKSDKPVYLHIKNDKVEIKDGSMVWGLGTRATTEVLNRLEGVSACVATIGPAGENLLPYACMMNSRNHSAGAGLGTVMGSKKLKALVVEGSGTVNVKDPQALADLSDYMLREIIGSNNNHVVPSTQQEWAEYYDKGTRWTARKGLYWADAEGDPIETGEPKPGEINTVGYRCMKTTKDEGPEAEKYTIKMNGCHSCPIHCYSDMRVPNSKANGGYADHGQHLRAELPVLRLHGEDSWASTLPSRHLPKTASFGTRLSAARWTIWACGATTHRFIVTSRTACLRVCFEKNLPADEYNMFDWKKFENNDPTIMVELLTHIAKNDNEMSYLGHGPIVWCKRWNDMEWFDTTASCLINYRGWPVHHAIESYGQVGGLLNMIFNRDPMIHSHQNMLQCGLPHELKQEIAAELWGGEDALDQAKNYTPINDHKINFCWWSIVTDVLHDSLTLCNWVWPMAQSPSKSRNYRGDLDLEAKFYKAATGKDVTTDDLYKAAAKIITLQRANTARGMKDKNGNMGCNDFRNIHDVMTEWPFTKDPDKQPFTEGTDKMEKQDFQKGLTMLYEKFGWDSELGCPTADCLEYYGMSDVEEDLKNLNLLP